ncbi:MAG: hypothetical protein ACLFTK_10585 [Anaerolineales bacterium]
MITIDRTRQPLVLISKDNPPTESQFQARKNVLESVLIRAGDDRSAIIYLHGGRHALLNPTRIKDPLAQPADDLITTSEPQAAGANILYWRED